MKSNWVWLASALALSACGGGGGGGGGGGSSGGGGTTNRAPSISTASSFSLLENTVDVGSVSASDPDGDALTYTITGGADRSLFSINSSSGALTMTEAPNYDRPTDADFDNFYEVTVQVSDGSLTASATYDVMVENDKEGIDVRLLSGSASGSVALTATFYGGLNDWRISTVTNTGHFRMFDNAGALVSDAMLAGPTTPDFDYLGVGIVRPDTDNLLVTLLRVEGRVELWATPMDRLEDATAPYVVWSRDYSTSSAPPTGSLICKEFCVLATGWNGNPADAQSTGDGFGEKIGIDKSSFGAYDNAGSWSFTPLALGLRDPVAVWPGDDNGSRNFVLDRGERYGEVNFEGSLLCGGASVSTCPSNFGWPYFDGPDDGPSMPPSTIDHIVPTFYRPQGSGLYEFDSISGLVLAPNVGDLGGTAILSDRNGNFYTIPWDVLRTEGGDDQTFEWKTEDFRPEVGAIGEVLAMIDTREMFGSGITPAVYILDSDGQIYVLR